jgi:protein TonB
MLRHLIIRNFQLALLCLVCIASSHAQTATKSYGRVNVEITKEKKPKKIYAKVDIKSAFTGGDSSWIRSVEKTLNQSIQYKNGAKAGKYIVTVIFVADKEGSISDIRCVNDPVGFGMEEEVLRAIRKGPKWVPSSQGIPVRPYRTSSSTPPVSN